MAGATLTERLVIGDKLTTMTNCSVRDCSRDVLAKGMCKGHYDRVRAGRPVGGPIANYMTSPNDTLLDRLAPRLAWDGEHLLWQGARSEFGYGVFQHNKKMWLAHRAAYTVAYGEIPKGLHLDHDPACPKNCVRPEHLTAMTQAEHNALTNSRPEEGLRNRQSTEGQCALDNCDHEIRARRLCAMHYNQFRRKGVI